MQGREGRKKKKGGDKVKGNKKAVEIAKRDC